MKRLSHSQIDPIEHGGLNGPPAFDGDATHHGSNAGHDVEDECGSIGSMFNPRACRDDRATIAFILIQVFQNAHRVCSSAHRRCRSEPIGDGRSQSRLVDLDRAAELEGPHVVQRNEVVHQDDRVARWTRPDLHILVAAQAEQMTDRFAHARHLERLSDTRFDELQNGLIENLDVFFLDPHLCDGAPQVVADRAFDGGHRPDSQNGCQQQNQDRLVPCATARAHQNTCLTRISSEKVSFSFRVKTHENRSVWSNSIKMI